MQSDPVGAVLERLTQVRKMGDGWMASCPTRRDAKPSLSIRVGTDGKVLLKDFGGSTIEEIVDAIGLTMNDLFVDDKSLQKSGWQRMAQTGSKPKRSYTKPQPRPVEGVGPGALQWFAARGIPEAVVTRFGIYTEGNVSFEEDGKWVRTNAICFPYTKDGVRVNVKFRSAERKLYKQFADGEPVFYNIDRVSADARDVLIVEGELDVLALAVAGVTDAISPPNGCNSLGEEVMASAKHLFDNPAIRFILAGDMDGKGEEMMEEFSRRVGKERCLRVQWPDDAKDANDTLNAGGVEAIQTAIAQATVYPVDGVITVSDVSNDLWQLYTDGLPSGFSTGSVALDQHYTVMPGYYTVVTGSSGSGKSTFLDWVAVNMAEMHDWFWAVASFENRIPRHLASLAAKYVRKPFREGYSQRISTEELLVAEEWISNHFGFIRPATPTIDDILIGARALVYQRGARAVIIDPWNRIYHPDSMNSGDMVAATYTKIGDFVSRYGVHVFIVAHPTKLPKQANGEYPVAHLGDISGSVNHWNMPDYGISVYRYRNDPGKPAEAHILKARHDEVASEGIVYLHYDRGTGRYSDAEQPGRRATNANLASTGGELMTPHYQGEEDDDWDGTVRDRPPTDADDLDTSYTG